MAVNQATWRTLRRLTLYSNHLKLINKAALRAMSTQAYNETVNRLLTHRGVQHEEIRKYGEWLPNIVKSELPPVPIPKQLFHEMFWSKHERWSNLPAAVCGLTGRELTYSELRKQCQRLATSLLKEGFEPGEVVALMLPNMMEFPVATLGILEAGLVVSTINPAYTSDEIAYQLKDSGAVAVITVPDKLYTVIEAKNMIGKEKLRVICTPDVAGKEADLPNGIIRFSDFVNDSVDASSLPSLLPKNRNQSDVIFIPYSSGTTGRPKGVCLTHINLISIIITMERIGDIQEPKNGVQDVVPCILPGFHIYGFQVVMSASLYNGAKLILLPRFEEKTFLKMLLEHKPTVLYVAPPLVLYLGSSPNITKEHLKSLRAIMSGAAPCSDTDIEKCVAKSPLTCVYKQGYGLTETAPIVTYMTGNTKKYSSVGPASLNTTIKVADLQTRQALGPNEEGEICVKGPQVMKGYLNNEKTTAESFDDGWFCTGDVGYYDNDKHFYITDRVKELIKVKGFQVAPAELEAVLRSHPGIEDAGVIGVPDPKKGETPVGFVKPKKGFQPTADDLKEYLLKKLAKYKQIGIFIFVESIPKSASGKILRKQLKEEYFKKFNDENKKKANQ